MAGELKRQARPRHIQPARARPTIALVLGGGGARGLAHILMLEAFDELGLRPSLIVGTSVGAVFGWAYASGLRGREVRGHAFGLLSRRLEILGRVRASRKAKLLKLTALAPLRTALLKPELLLEVIAPDDLKRDFAELAIPLEVVATDYYARSPSVVTRGAILPAVAASMAVPGLFAPVMIDGRAHVDGGLVNPLPFDLVAGRADITIAIDVSGGPRRSSRRDHPSALEAMFAAVQILEHTVVEEKLRRSRPDILIDAAIDQFRVLEFHRIADILACAEPAKEELKRAIMARLEHPRPAARERRLH
jgi:NTE family protein